MSLENEIVKLTEAVQALTAQLNGLTLPVASAPVVEKTKAKLKPVPVPEPVPVPVPVPELKGEALTEQDLVDLCIEVSRAKIGVNNKKIRTLMQSYGECRVVKDIPVEHWSDFKAKLEALRDE